MTERDVDIPVKSSTREWLLKAKGDMTYDQFLNQGRSRLERVRQKPYSVYTQTVSEDNSVGPLKLQLSGDNSEVKNSG